MTFTGGGQGLSGRELFVTALSTNPANLTLES